MKISCLCLIIGLFTLSCNSGSGNGVESAGFFSSTPNVDLEKLQYILTDELEDSAGVKEFLAKADLPVELNEAFLQFYKERDYLPAWINEDGLTKQSHELLEAIESCPENGLNPEDYKLAYLQHLEKKLDGDNAEMKDYKKFDKELTSAYLNLANHLLRGRIDPASFDETWLTDRRKKDLATHLQKAIEKDVIIESLQNLEPKYDGYKGLKEALARYQELKEKSSSWISIPKSLNIKPGDSDKHVPEIAKMLMILGDLETRFTGNTYNGDLVAAVLSFQERNGLMPDSVIGGKTISMLNISPGERAEQIKLNMERFRWLPEKPKGRHIIVNIPEYKAYIYEGADSTFSMKVIVGKAYESTTPVFNDTMEYVTFSPTWTVPMSIAAEEMLPKLKEDPEYLAKKDFKLYESWEEDAKELDAKDINWKNIDAEEFSYRVVQNPGERNSLGRVKFMFPNELDIYLHDTPADYLFNKSERDFSHGCIRVEKPVEFAEYLLQDQGVDKPAIEELMNQPEPEEIALKTPVPVIIEYRTAWMGPKGRVNFREDIYGHDRKQTGTLKKAVAEADEKTVK